MYGLLIFLIGLFRLISSKLVYIISDWILEVITFEFYYIAKIVALQYFGIEKDD